MRRDVIARLCVLLSTAVAVCLGAPNSALAQDASDHVYVVARGDTVSSIAQHLGVATPRLAERNHLAPPYALRIGRRLRLPDGVDETVLRALPLREGVLTPASSTASVRDAAHGSRHNPIGALASNRGHGRGGRNWGTPRHPGVVRLVREYNDEGVTINLRRITPHARRRMEMFLRFPDGRHHPMHLRLLRQIAVVSDHFGGRPLHVVSGFRPFRHGQWTAHSNHNVGAAMDFRIEGVSNRALRDYCRTLPSTGCGFYPRSVFVHMDVRTESATWVDWSRPGQRPMYGREDRPPSDTVHASATAHAQPTDAPSPEGADESVDDVASDSTHVRDAPAPTDNGDEPGDDHEHAPGTVATGASSSP